MRSTEIKALQKKAGAVSSTLRLLANQNRLLVLCRLALEDEMSVTALGKAINLSQSALSQHLAKLKADGLVNARRESQIVFYRIADSRIRQLLDALYAIYCASPGGKADSPGNGRGERKSR
jgi:ArsR family transcriptional regulator, virulence genes transcriptional regulator